MTLARRGFLAAISAALLAPFAKTCASLGYCKQSTYIDSPPKNSDFGRADDSQEFCAKVGPVVSEKSSLILTIMPSKVSIGIGGEESDLSGLIEGDYIRFHIEKSEVVWKGRHIHVRNVELTP